MSSHFLNILVFFRTGKFLFKKNKKPKPIGIGSSFIREDKVSFNLVTIRQSGQKPEPIVSMENLEEQTYSIDSFLEFWRKNADSIENDLEMQFYVMFL